MVSLWGATEMEPATTTPLLSPDRQTPFPWPLTPFETTDQPPCSFFSGTTFPFCPLAQVPATRWCRLEFGQRSLGRHLSAARLKGEGGQQIGFRMARQLVTEQFRRPARVRGSCLGSRC